MKFNLVFIFLILISCTQYQTAYKEKQTYNSKGLAYIYTNQDFINKQINKKFDSALFQVGHHSLNTGSLIKIINPKTNDSIVVSISKKVKYPNFYKVLVTKPVADKLNLNINFPFVEVIEIKKNKSFVAKKTKVFEQEKKVKNKAPVQKVEIDNIARVVKKKQKKINEKIYIIIAEFYSKESALLLKKRISEELINFDSKKIRIKDNNNNKINLLSGPYKTINLMKNDYILLQNFGFEELDISINE